jgi:hypothetical protein
MEGSLTKIIATIRERIVNGKYQSESAVREAIILPILNQLGWDSLDPDVVIRELNLSGRRVDYGLAVHPARPNIFVEVKAIGGAGGADRQLFEYAFHEGIPMAVLTDGREWHFYLPAEQGPYEERRVYKLDLIEREAEESSRFLGRYMEFSRVKSGIALEDAKRDFREASNHRLASQSVPRAWHEIVTEPDELLIEIIAERTESICGYRPDAVEIEKFLIEHERALQTDAPTLPPRMAQRNQQTAPPKSDSRSGKIEYRLLDRSYTAPNATEALIAILKAFAAKQPKFWARLEPLARSRKRNHIARTRRDVYPDKPELEQYTMEIAPGWWLGTNVANREKKRLLEAACNAAGLRFGADLQINLPNT